MFRYSCTEKAEFKLKTVFVMMQEYYGCQFTKAHMGQMHLMANLTPQFPKSSLKPWTQQKSQRPFAVTFFSLKIALRRKKTRECLEKP